jgi:hypothetical protein
MMRVLIFIFFLFILVFRLSSQTLAEKYDFIKDDFLGKTFIGVSAGAGIPFKEFSSTDFKSSNSGYAKPGFDFNIVFRYAFTPYIGGTFKYINSSNPYDGSAYQNGLNQFFSKYNYSGATYTSDPYQIYGIMMGPTFIIPSPKLNFETSVCVGNITGALPANKTYYNPPLPVSLYTSQGIINTKLLSQNQTVYNANNFAVTFDVAFRYMIAKNLILSASADIFICDITFKSMQQLITDTAGNVYAGSLPNYLQPFRLVHLNIGIGFQLDK